MRLGTRSGRSRFNGVPGRAMEQVKGEGRAEALGPLGHRQRSGRGWRSGAGPGAVRGGRAAVWGRPSSGGGEGVRAAAHRAGGEQCGEAGPRGAPGPLSVRRLTARRGGPGGRRQFGLSPTRGGKRGRGWAPEASREVALGLAEGGGGNTAGGAGRNGGGRGASVEAGGTGSTLGDSPAGRAGIADGEATRDLATVNLEECRDQGREYTGSSQLGEILLFCIWKGRNGRALSEGLISGGPTLPDAGKGRCRQSPWNGFHLYQCFTDVCAAPPFLLSFRFCVYVIRE